MKSMRENHFSEVRQWVPFILIGDDVTFEGLYLILFVQYIQVFLVTVCEAGHGLCANFVPRNILFCFSPIIYCG